MTKPSLTLIPTPDGMPKIEDIVDLSVAYGPRADRGRDRARQGEARSEGGRARCGEGGESAPLL